MSESVRKRKDFKDSPLGKVPQDWEVYPAIDVCQAVIDCKNRTPPVLESGYPVVRTTNVRDGRFVRQNLVYTDERSYEIWTQRGKPRPGDILITREAPVGEACLIPEDIPEACLGQRMMMYQVNPSVMDNRFMVLSLLSEAVQSRLADLAGGSTVGHVRVDDIRQLFVHVPPILEQSQIADIANEIDSTIAHTTTLIAKLKQMKAGLLNDLLTRGLDENGELRDAIGHPKQFKDSPMGQVPKNWSISDLTSISKRVTDGSHQAVKTSEEGVPFLYVSCIRDGQILWDQAAKISSHLYAEISRGREPQPGLILYTAVGSYGHAALVQDQRDFGFQRHIAYILPDSEKVNSEYLVSWLNSSQCKAYADKVALGNAQKTVTLGELSKFPVILPSLEEQNLIISTVESGEYRIRKEEAYLNKLKEQKKGLMHDLLTGRVRVTDLKDTPP
jgi:type I restriction enzyme, S subunit